MALCLAESLLTCQGLDAADQMTRYRRWSKDGHLSSTGECFDIGNTVSDALRKFAETGDPYAGSTDPYSAGNGSLMRLAPVPMFFQANPAEAINQCAESSRTTHAAETCIDGCRYFGGMLIGALAGAGKDELLSADYCPVPGLWEQEPLCPEISEIAKGSFKDKNPPDIVGSGYVVESLEAALWAFYRSENFRDGCLLAVNLGNDADTTAAIYGQIAGAHYGVNSIPASWRDQLAEEALLQEFAANLSHAASLQDTQPERP